MLIFYNSGLIFSFDLFSEQIVYSLSVGFNTMYIAFKHNLNVIVVQETKGMELQEFGRRKLNIITNSTNN